MRTPNKDRLTLRREANKARYFLRLNSWCRGGAPLKQATKKKYLRVIAQWDNEKVKPIEDKSVPSEFWRRPRIKGRKDTSSRRDIDKRRHWRTIYACKSFLGNKCATGDCHAPVSELEFHHINFDGREHRRQVGRNPRQVLQDWIRRGRPIVKGEKFALTLVCRMHHQILTAMELTKNANEPQPKTKTTATKTCKKAATAAKRHTDS